MATYIILVLQANIPTYLLRNMIIWNRTMCRCTHKVGTDMFVDLQSLGAPAKCINGQSKSKKFLAIRLLNFI